MLEKVTTHALTITHEGFTGTSASFVVSRTGEDVQGVDIVLTDAVPDHGPTGWVESPANGHRYKSVEAGSWFECHLAAIAGRNRGAIFESTSSVSRALHT